MLSGAHNCKSIDIGKNKSRREDERKTFCIVINIDSRYELKTFGIVTVIKRIAEEESGESIVVVSPVPSRDRLQEAVQVNVRRSDQLVVGDPERVRWAEASEARRVGGTGRPVEARRGRGRTKSPAGAAEVTDEATEVQRDQRVRGLQDAHHREEEHRQQVGHLRERRHRVLREVRDEQREKKSTSRRQREPRAVA